MSYKFSLLTIGKKLNKNVREKHRKKDHFQFRQMVNGKTTQGLTTFSSFCRFQELQERITAAISHQNKVVIAVFHPVKSLRMNRFFWASCCCVLMKHCFEVHCFFFLLNISPTVKRHFPEIKKSSQTGFPQEL